MILIVWLVVGIGAFLVLAVLGYGLFGHLKRLRRAVSGAQTEMVPRAEDLFEGIRTAQALRMHDGADATRGHHRHA